MLIVSGLSVHYGARTLFDEISFQVNQNECVGLVGLNGAGKSTLLKVLAGRQKPDFGHINTPNEYTIGYLPQQLTIDVEQTVYASASQAFGDILQIEHRLEKVQQKIENIEDYQSDEYAKLIDELTHLSHRLELMGADQMEKKIYEVLTGLGFTTTDGERKLTEFSGGWQMRVELAKILLSAPDLLLLDEPTNHLDIESIIWLEGFLKAYQGAIIMVSHDKALLDNVTTRTIEIEAGKVYDYKSNYSKYLQLREERREKLIAEKKNQDKYIEHTEQLINKFRAKKNKAAFAQSLIKKLDKLDRVEMDEMDASAIKLRFPEPPRSGKVVAEIKHLSKSYGAKEVLEDIELIIERGDKVAFVGKNGEGKTTLSKILAGTLDHEGEINYGGNVSIGYYAQHQEEMLDLQKTVYQTIEEDAPVEMHSRIRSLLGSLLFSGEDVDKKIQMLSGGERARVSLAKLLLRPVNFLILDEPTNHLDMRSKEILKTALQEYSGTMLVVSHDREFLDGLTQKVYEFSNKKIKEYLGDLSYFLEKKELDHMRQLEMQSTKANAAKANAAQNTSSSKEQYEQKKEFDRVERKLRSDISKSEKAIEKLEKEAGEFEKQINEPDFYQKASEPDKVFHKYNQLKMKLEKEMEQWAKWNEELEQLKGQKELLS